MWFEPDEADEKWQKGEFVLVSSRSRAVLVLDLPPADLLRNKKSKTPR